MLAPHISVVNLGCRVNRVESDRITADLMRLGFAIVEPQDADLIVINTCAVTGEAEAKTRKAVRHALAHPNEPYVLVTGCVVNLHPEELLELSDRVIAEPSKIDVAERVCDVLGVESDSVAACSDEGEGSEWTTESTNERVIESARWGSVPPILPRRMRRMQSPQSAGPMRVA